METVDDNKYVVFICNIHWSNTARNYVKKSQNEELPTQMSLDIPESVLAQAQKNKANFNDIIEQFCYNLLTKKYGYEVYNCQIWLPLD